jgi:hypothetical protein
MGKLNNIKYYTRKFSFVVMTYTIFLLRGYTYNPPTLFKKGGVRKVFVASI